MDNEVVISVKSKNDTKAGFDSVRNDAKKVGDDSGDNFHKSFVARLAGSASQIAPKLAATITKGVASAGEASGPLLAGGIIAAAPLIGSAMSGAIIGGAGLGGVVGGVLLVKDDPRVAAAFTGLATRVGSRLKDAALPFVDTTIKGVAQIETSLKKVDFEGIFAKASTFVQPLAGALGHVAEDLGAGFGSLIQVADPVIQRIAKGLADIGGAARKGLESLADNADTAAASLGVLFDTVKTGTTVTFGLINGLTELKAKFDSAAGGMFAFDSGLRQINAIFSSGNGTKWMDPDPVDAFNQAVANGVTTFDGYGNAITSAGQSLQEMAAQAEAAGDANRNLFDSETSVQAALDSLDESIKKNGKSLDAHTEKGRANRTALSNLARAMNGAYDAYVAANGAGKEADSVASSNYDSFIKAAHGLGIGKSAAEAYARQLGLIPPNKNTKVNANTHDAEGRIKALQDKLRALRDKYVTIHVTTVGSASVNQRDNADRLKNAHGGVRGAASGGARDGLTWVGEEGPELVDIPAGSRVMTAGDSRRFAAAQNGGGGPVQIMVKLDPRADPFMRALLEALRFEINGQGGNVQTVLT